MTEEAARAAVEETVDEEDEEVIELLAELKPVIELAVACANRLSVVGGAFAQPLVMGFDLTAVEIVAKWMGIMIDQAMGEDLRTLEAHMLKLLSAAGEAP